MKTSFMLLFHKSSQTFLKHFFTFLCIMLSYFLFFLILDYFVFGNEGLKKALILQHTTSFYFFLQHVGRIFLVVGFFFYFCVLIKAVSLCEHKMPVHVWDAYKAAASDFPAYLKVKLLYIVKVLMYSLLLIIPGIMVMIRGSLGSFAVLIDGKRGNEALVLSQKFLHSRIKYYLSHLCAGIILGLALFTPFISLLNEASYFLWIKNYYFLSDLVAKMRVFVILNLAVFLSIFFYYVYQDLKMKFQTAKD